MLDSKSKARRRPAPDRNSKAPRHATRAHATWPPPAYMYVSEFALEMLWKWTGPLDCSALFDRITGRGERGVTAPGREASESRSFCCHLRRKNWLGRRLAAAVEFQITLASPSESSMQAAGIHSHMHPVAERRTGRERAARAWRLASPPTTLTHRGRNRHEKIYIHLSSPGPPSGEPFIPLGFSGFRGPFGGVNFDLVLDGS